MNIINRQNSTYFTVLTEEENVLVEEESILTLAPFSKTPKIDFGFTKADSKKPIVRFLCIKNVQSFVVNLRITCQDLKINNLELSIPRKEALNLEIKWEPETHGNYKHAILFEVTNATKLKFIVHAFGVCLPALKRVRKPLATFQPEENIIIKNDKYYLKKSN